MLDESTIAKLEARGLARWTKGDMDRLYLNKHNGKVCGVVISDKLRKEMHGRNAKKCYINIKTGNIVSDRAELKRIAEKLLAEAEGRELPPKPARKTKAQREAEIAQKAADKIKGPLVSEIGNWCREHKHEKPIYREMSAVELANWFFNVSGIDLRISDYDAELAKMIESIKQEKANKRKRAQERREQHTHYNDFEGMTKKEIYDWCFDNDEPEPDWLDPIRDGYEDYME